MDTLKILELCGLLGGKTTGVEKELSEIYKRALDKDDSYRTLKKLTDTSAFSYYGSNGESYLNRIIKLMNDATDPRKIRNVLPLMKNCVNDIQAEIRESERYAVAFDGTDSEVRIIHHSLERKLSLLYDRLIHAVYYYLYISGNKDKIDFAWNPDFTIARKCTVINRGLKIIKESDKGAYCWMIRRENETRTPWFWPVYYKVVPLSIREYRQKKESINDYEKVSYNLYRSLRTSKDRRAGIEYIGEGQLISKEPDQIFSIYGHTIYTSYDGWMKGDGNITNSRTMDINLQDILKKAFPDEEYLVPVTLVVKLMNQYMYNSVIETRRKRGACILCGKARGVSGGCEGHIRMR